MIGEPTQAKLREIIQPLVYSDESSLLETKRLYYDSRPHIRKIRLDGFIPENYLRRDLEGTGTKLVKLTQERIEAKLPELEVKAVTGYEPRFFLRELGGNHPFLIVNTRGQDDITVVDPSFKYVGALQGADYGVTTEWCDFAPLHHT